MRLATLTIASLLALPCAARAQEGRVEVRTVATVRIPDVLQIQEIETTDLTDSAGRVTTRTGLRVTANRGWVLSVGSNYLEQVEQILVGGRVRSGDAPIAEGRRGNRMPVELEIRWKERQTTTPTRLVYHLAAQ